MTTHPTRAMLASYREGTLTPSQLLEVDDHIAACQECRTVVNAGAGSDRALRGFVEAIGGDHVTYEAMERCVNGDLTADEDTQVAAHLAICETCANEVADLARYARPRPRTQPWRWLTLASAAAAAAILVVVIAFRGDRPLPRREIAVAPIASRPAPPTTTTPTTPEVGLTPEPLQSLDPALRRVAESLQSGTVVSAQLLASLHRGPEQQRGDVEEGVLRVIEPIGVVVESDRPTFRWNRRSSVTVQVFDSEYALVAESPRLDATSWRATKALRRGATYRWQLLVHTADGPDAIAPAPPAPPALFHILNQRGLAELTKARDSGAALEGGLIALREGLLDEGSRLLEQYAAEHPASDVATRLAQRARDAAQSAPTAMNGAQ